MILTKLIPRMTRKCSHIFFVERKILGIGPKIRVPINFCCLFNRITEFSKKKNYRKNQNFFVLVLTIKALKISPFLTFEKALLFS